jgi:hypothetical protein
MSSIYLIQEREFINTNESVIKIGRTNNIAKRFLQYPKGSLLLFSIYINPTDLISMEKQLLYKFGGVFRARADIGREYFEGDINEMIKTIVNNVKDVKYDEKKQEDIVFIKKDPTIALMDYVNENRQILSNSIISSKYFYNEFLEYIKSKSYDLHMTHTKMSRDLSKCYNVKHKVHRFESGVEQGLCFPDLLLKEHDLIIVEEPKLKHDLIIVEEPKAKKLHNTKTLYSCIRCNYSTERKSNMFYHLYKMKKPCPGTKNVIELTDEIKQHILDNRIYKIPEEPKAPTNLFINRPIIR